MFGNRKDEIILDLTKPGQEAEEILLDLVKKEKFTVTAYWEGEADLDIHAFACHNSGVKGENSYLIDGVNSLLTTYNVRRTLGGGRVVGTLELNPKDGTFQIMGGALKHSPDALAATEEDVDEFIEIDPALIGIPQGVAFVEIPIIISVHPKQVNGKMLDRFEHVKNMRISIKDASGREVANVSQSAEFNKFNLIQMGSIIISSKGSSYAKVGNGFENMDLNDVIKAFR